MGFIVVSQSRFLPFAHSLIMQNTWKELEIIKRSENNCPLIYHYHVPKTGGTSIFANLRHSSDWFPFNSDNSIETIKCELSDYKRNIKPNSGPIKLYGRSHNLANRLRAQKANEVYDTAFTFYRDPLSIQLSNINMIVRRIVSLFKSEYRPGSILYEWTYEWILCLEINESDIDDSPELAQRVATSDLYSNRYAGIVSRYFPERADELHSFLKEMKMTIFSMDTLDAFQSSILGIQSPTVANKNKIYYITKDDLPAKICKKLVARDTFVCNSIQNVLVSSLEDLSEFHWMSSVHSQD